MKNISTFCSKSDIRSEINKVYVYSDPKRENKRYAVATDSFRLAEIEVADDIQAGLPEGYYSIKEWTTLCSILNKKKIDYEALLSITNGIKSMQERYNHYTYPEYTAIIPKDEDCETVSLKDICLNKDYFIELLELITVDQFNILNMHNFKQKKGNITSPIVYRGEGYILLILPLNQ
jgi:DNA polymerase III sliding clamp (beta) subunit (PCNA family)